MLASYYPLLFVSKEIPVVFSKDTGVTHYSGGREWLTSLKSYILRSGTRAILFRAKIRWVIYTNINQITPFFLLNTHESRISQNFSLALYLRRDFFLLGEMDFPLQFFMVVLSPPFFYPVLKSLHTADASSEYSSHEDTEHLLLNIVG